MQPPFIVGQMVTLRGDFRDNTTTAGNYADPTTIVFKIKDPTGVETIYTYGVDAQLVRSDIGRYYVNWTCAVVGTHTFRFAGTGTIVAADESEFAVSKSYA